LRRWRWQRAVPEWDVYYRARAADLSELRWDHPGLARVAAYRVASQPEEVALAAAREALEGRFRFLGRPLDLGAQPDWFRSDLDAGTRLWKTLLHEFGWGTDLARAAAANGDPRYRQRFLELARDWRSRAPIGCRDFALDAWNARAVATRLMHWAVAGCLLELRGGDDDADWLGREIGLHGLFLRDNLELDLRGNHLFRDVAGLVFAEELAGGVPDALAWLERVVAEQVLPDGCHEERAPLYHALCTRDLLEVALLLGEARPDWLGDALGRMAGFLEEILLGDGEIPLLGDGWLGEVATPALLRAAREICDPIAPATPERPDRRSGLVPLHAGPWRVVLRAGRHAPDEQMGHAHADLLSFDASHGRERIVTDTGTLLYDEGPERQRIRGTGAHNTLRIDGEEQIEAWGSFRVGRRGRARVTGRGSCGEGTGTWQWVSASHDAYGWLKGRPAHHRLLAVAEQSLLVLDAVFGTGEHEIETHLHEHPDNASAQLAIVALPGSAAGPAAVEAAPLHEHFGQSRPMRRHRLASSSALPWIGGWWITRGAAPDAAPALALDGDALRVQLASPRVGLEWHPLCTDGEEAVFLCSPSDGSAN
jgi:uncharacterized heparinase superfamily protein